MRRAYLVIPMLSLLLATPARATGGNVSVSYAVHYTQVGGGYVVVVACDATATSNDGDIALLTTVSCGVNGGEESRTLPGSRSAVVTANAAVMPIVLCYSAGATFLDPAGAAYDVTLTRTCIQVAPRG